MPLPVALNMGRLYEQIIQPLVGSQTSRLVPGAVIALAEEDQPVSLEEQIAHAEAVRTQVRQIDQIKSRLSREKQFNRRVKINAELRAAKAALKGLTEKLHDDAVIED